MLLNKRWLKTLGAVLFWIALWHFAAVFVDSEFLLPSPITTVKTLFTMAGTKKFWLSVAISISRIVAGFLLALILGSLCGVISAHVKWFSDLFSPLLHVIRSVPVASFIILVLVWLKTNNIPIFISFLMVFPMFWDRMQSAFDSVDKKLLELCHVMRVPFGEKLRAVYLPVVIPALRGVCITGIGFAWKSGVAAEVICKPQSALGTLLSNGKTALETPEVFAVTLVIVILSIVFDSVLKKAWRAKDVKDQ